MCSDTRTIVLLCAVSRGFGDGESYSRAFTHALDPTLTHKRVSARANTIVVNLQGGSTPAGTNPELTPVSAVRPSDVDATSYQSAPLIET